MKITREEYDREIASLKDLGLTPEEIDGFIEFFDYAVEIEGTKRIRVLNTGSRRKNDSS